jgi:hypothetical protein
MMTYYQEICLHLHLYFQFCLSAEEVLKGFHIRWYLNFQNELKRYLIKETF